MVPTAWGRLSWVRTDTLGSHRASCLLIYPGTGTARADRHTWFPQSHLSAYLSRHGDGTCRHTWFPQHGDGTCRHTWFPQSHLCAYLTRHGDGTCRQTWFPQSHLCAYLTRHGDGTCRQTRSRSLPCSRQLSDGCVCPTDLCKWVCFYHRLGKWVCLYHRLV